MIRLSFGRTALVTCTLLAGMASLPANAEELPKDAREKMAQMHEQMAACLRSDKPVQVCRDEMLNSCQQQLGNEGCRAARGMNERPRMRPNGTGTPPG